MRLLIARYELAAIAASGLVIGSLVVTPTSTAQAAAAGKPQAVTWSGFAENAQHTSTAQVRPQLLHRVRWRATVDKHPLVFLGSLPTHYGSPMITAANSVLVPTKVSVKAGYRVIAYSAADGARRWSLSTDYRLTVFGARLEFAWRPPLPAVLTPRNALAVAGVGGTVLVRQHADLAVGSVRRLVFYGAAQWKAHPAVYDKAVQVTTPLTAGPDGSLYFGFTVTGATPAHPDQRYRQDRRRWSRDLDLRPGGRWRQDHHRRRLQLRTRAVDGRLEALYVASSPRGRAASWSGSTPPRSSRGSRSRSRTRPPASRP